MEATRFRPLATACPWVSSEPRRAVVNAFGIGGANAHVILEQAPVGASPASAASTAPLTLPPARPPRRTPPTVSEPEQVLRFAAPTPEALIDLLDDDDAILRERGAGVPQYQGPGSRLGLVGPTERRLAVARRVARGARGGRMGLLEGTQRRVAELRAAADLRAGPCRLRLPGAGGRVLTADRRRRRALRPARAGPLPPTASGGTAAPCCGSAGSSRQALHRIGVRPRHSPGTASASGTRCSPRGSSTTTTSRTSCSGP